MYEVMIERHFSASHFLTNYTGVCEKLHGHNYLVQLWARCSHLDKANISIDYKCLKQCLDAYLKQLDHSHLNENSLLGGESPSSEYLARLIYQHVKQSISQVSKVCVFETPGQCACYFEEESK
jgi:6-pyruvoyltetrahydropterin/6-carboxytetrahydropterin synthase